MSVPPPQGMTEHDYEAIEAAVTETVRGRWFLGEFARRNRAGEMRQVLDAVARLETRFDGMAQPALPSADPSVRMLIQRIKEIAGQLDGLSQEMREEGIEARFVEAVDLQARAVSGMMRSAPPARPVAPPQQPAQIERRPASEPVPAVAAPAPMRMPRANLPASLAAAPSARFSASGTPADPRLAALSGLDGLTLAKKLAVFS